MLRRAFVLSFTLAAGCLGACGEVTPPGMAPPPAAGGTLPASRPAATSQPAPDAGTTVPQAPPRVQSERDPKVAEFVGLRGPKPATWVFRPPTSRMRAANYTIPGRDGADSAELIVFYFGPTQGGDVASNVARWKTQFRSADGGTVEPVVTTLDGTSLPTTLVEQSGEWQRTGQGWFSPDQTALRAIVVAPAGSVYIQLGGPSVTVEANREPFLRLLEGLQVSDGELGGLSD